VTSTSERISTDAAELGRTIQDVGNSQDISVAQLRDRLTAQEGKDRADKHWDAANQWINDHGEDAEYIAWLKGRAADAKSMKEKIGEAIGHIYRVGGQVDAELEDDTAFDGELSRITGEDIKAHLDVAARELRAVRRAVELWGADVAEHLNGATKGAGDDN
jgi:hypothetical protein